MQSAIFRILFESKLERAQPGSPLHPHPWIWYQALVSLEANIIGSLLMVGLLSIVLALYVDTIW